MRAGKLRALGVASLKPSAVTPDIPALAQNGIPGYQVELWWGIFAPADTSPAIVGRLNTEINKIVETPEMREAFMRDGAEPMTMRPAEFASLIGEEIPRWKSVAKRAGITAD